MQVPEPAAEGGDVLRHRLGRTRAVQPFGDIAGKFRHIRRRHAEAHDLRRAEPEAIDVTLDCRQRQADAAGEDIDGAQLLRRRLPATEARGLDRELV